MMETWREEVAPCATALATVQNLDFNFNFTCISKQTLDLAVKNICILKSLHWSQPDLLERACALA